jgi:predicted permease
LQVDQRPNITVPIAFEPELERDNPSMDRPGKPGRWWVHLMGRLKPGATVAQAQESLGSAFQYLALELMPPPRGTNQPARLEAKDYPRLIASPGSRGMWEGRKFYSSKIYLLWGVVGLILLIACANVANLLLARGILRIPEIALRLAIGAGPRRVFQQLVTESVLITMLGGAVGVLFALWGKNMLTAIGNWQMLFLPPDIDYSLNWRALGFALAVSLLTGIFLGVAPAWRAMSLDLTTAFKESNRHSSSASRSPLSKALVITQVAISLLLLIGAGLFVRTLRNLEQVEVGFNQENLLLFSLQPGANGYRDESLVQFYRQVFSRIDAIPGVSSASFASTPLISQNGDNCYFFLPGESAQSGTDRVTNRQIVRENYFATMEIPLLRGRPFTERDNQNAPKVVIISETLARKFFPGEDPIGKHVGFNAETIDKVEIIGVASDIKYSSQREENEPLIYLPWLQRVDAVGEMQYALRVSGDSTALINAARRAVREVDANLPLIGVKTQVEQGNEALAQERFYATLLSFFGALALSLAAVGLYGVMAYSVAQRTSEIGVRMALGARKIDILRLVIWQGLKLTLTGLLIGALASFALRRVIENQLYHIAATDPLTFAAAGALLMIIAVLACWIPARRSAMVDPMAAFRNE